MNRGLLLRELGLWISTLTARPLVSRGADWFIWRIAWGQGTYVGRPPKAEWCPDSSPPCTPAVPIGSALCWSRGEPSRSWKSWPRLGGGRAEVRQFVLLKEGKSRAPLSINAQNKGTRGSALGGLGRAPHRWYFIGPPHPRQRVQRPAKQLKQSSSQKGHGLFVSLLNGLWIQR